MGVYFKNLLFELAALDRDNEYCLFSASFKDRFPRAKVPPFAKLKFVDKRWPVRAVNAAWDMFGRPTLDRVFGGRLDLSHSPTPLCLPASGKAIVTVCDLFFMEEPAKADREARDRFLRKTENSLRSADGIVTISEYSARAIQDRFGLDAGKIKVTYLGLNRIFEEPSTPEETGEIRRRLDLPGDFLLFVGALEPRKNVPALIEALALIHEKRGRIPLVLAGRSGDDRERIGQAIDKRGLQSWVRRAGYLSDVEIRALYRAASALVFPSYAEGFGLPLLEAMACGLPAAVSGVSALPEIGGEAALYFKPEDPEDIAQTVLRLMEDGPLRDTLRIRGGRQAGLFRWRRTAETTLGFYQETVGRA
ncbi:MAG: glycosyltransferase family 1 protein [Candidatus Aminicenantes bacterium]|nr:glycosyltransferase family 1 protein [Candidatus Aminicenantes bacterium]